MDKRKKLLALGFTEEKIARLLGGDHVEDAAKVEESIVKTGDEPLQMPPQQIVDFIHLHNHTDYSTLDGICRIPDLVSRAVALGMPAVAMTDHGNISGAIQFYRTAMDAGVKPIIGCEVYTVPDMHERIDRKMWHLVLLAKNLTGYRNLAKITSAGYLEGFYYQPRVDLELISQHSEGLIAITACLKGYIPAMILAGNEEEARAELGRLRDIFAGDLYVEIMDHGMEEQQRVNPELIRLAGDMGTKLLASNDSHYINAEDATAHEVLLCIQTKARLADENRFRFPSDQFWFRTPDEMAALFPPEYLTRTLEVAEKCNLELDLSISHMPQFQTPDRSSAEEYLWQRIQEGVHERGEMDTVRQERLQHEYDMICRTGFPGYFCIIDDMVRFARRSGIRVGAGRGSAVASLVCSTLGITGVDPIEHDLLFERFLTADRVSPPDIDVDFDATRRGEITEYLRREYGHTASIITFNRLSPRSLVRDVGRVLGVNQAEMNAASSAIPNHTEETLAELRDEIDKLRTIDQRVIDIGTRLHGVIRHSSRHPGGVVVSNEPLTKHIPLRLSGGKSMTQFDKNCLEIAGMLKLDVLGNEYLTIAEMTLDLIRERHEVDISDIPMDDHRTYQLISSGDVSGIFQLGARWGRQLALQMQPRCFRDIIHIISIGRPGVLDSGLADAYFEARDSGDIRYSHSSLEPILRDTYGVILFQEQIMQIAVEAAGFNWSDADGLRKAIGKKDMILMASIQTQFVDGCVDMPREIATELWRQIQHFGGYGFNKAHAAGYADLTYRTAYLKANYFIEYFAALLSVKGDDEDDRRKYIRGLRRREVEILLPDINASTDRYTIVGEAIRLPLTAVSGLAKKAYSAIIEARSDGGFSSYEDLYERVDSRTVHKGVREKLVMAGAFDGLHDRQELLQQLEIPDSDILSLEFEALGLYLGHPLGDTEYNGALHIGEVADLSIGSEFRTVGIVAAMTPHIDRNGGSMAFVTIEDRTHELEVVIFARDYREELEVGDVIHLQANLDQPLKAIAIDYEIQATLAAV